MNFSFISKISLILTSIFIFSCQDTILSLSDKDNLAYKKEIFKFEKNDNLDLNSYYYYEKNTIDIYTTHSSSANFLNKINNLKINNYENNYLENTPINIIYAENNFFSFNKNGELLKFKADTGKLITRYLIDYEIRDRTPVSFSLHNNDFIVGFKSGEVIRINKLGKLIWSFDNKDLLITPIKIYDNKIIILYSEKIIILSPLNGEIDFEKDFKASNIIQSSGGKIIDYYNLLFFILPNSEFKSLDILLFDLHNSDLDKIELNTTINNLNDKINIFNNYFIYLDNGNTVYTYDLIKNKFLLSNFILNNSSSSVLFNNSIIIKNEKFLNFYNIINGNLFFQLNIEDLLSQNSKLVNALIINKKLHLFMDNGKIIIIKKDFSIEEVINVKIKDIIQVYSYQSKIFINTEKGITYIY